MTNPTQPALSKYPDIERILTDFHIALEACRQKAVIDRALVALGAGQTQKAREILSNLDNPAVKKGTI